MSALSLLLLFAVGLAAGVINVFAGGGSALTLPVLILVGFPAAVANGTNRIALIFQNITGVATFRHKGMMDLRLSAQLALAILPGALLGALVSVRLDDELFRRILLFVILGIVLATVLRGRKGEAKERSVEVSPRQRLAAMGLLFFVGFYMGFIQAGVGFLLIAALSWTTGLDLVRVNAQKLALVLVGASLALAVFVSQGKVAWGAGLVMAAGNSLGAFGATHLAVKGGEIWARRVLVATALLLAVKMLLL